MPVDYRDAADRHWGDAGALFTDSRLANADHLFGLAAECALKSVMEGIGKASLPAGGALQKQYYVHIDQLWSEFVSFANARGEARYAFYLIGIPNPFQNWHVSQRYSHRSDFQLDVVKEHKTAAEHTRAVLDQAVVDGVVL